MLRPRLPRLLVDGSRLTRSLQPQTRKYATKRPPNPESVNYPLLSKLYNGVTRIIVGRTWRLNSFTEYLEYSEGEERNVHKINAFKEAISALDNLPFQVQRIQDVEKVRLLRFTMARYFSQT
jgi:hypothetical protein